jgi:hypothetical protein
VKVRITRTPRERELDGVRLDHLRPGSVRDLSPGLATWLVAERYADIEMRQDVRTYDDDFAVKESRSDSTDPKTPRRRSSDY